MTLDKLKTGECGRIISVRGEGELRHHLLDMGLTPGTEVSLRKTAPMGDPVQLVLRGYELTLRLAEAAKIEIVSIESMTDFIESVNATFASFASMSASPFWIITLFVLVRRRARSVCLP